MLEAALRSASPDRSQLPLLLTEIGRARGRLDAARGAPRPTDQLLLRRALLEALEAYASAIATCGAPLPYRMRAEIDLYKGLGPRG
jgi:hypothetical protein